MPHWHSTFTQVTYDWPVETGVPMRCTNPQCGYSYYDKKSFKVQNSSHIYINGAIASCPRCGRPAQQTENLAFNADRHGVWSPLRESLTPEGVQLSDYQVLLGILIAAQASQASAEEVSEAIATSAPIFRNLADHLPRERTTSFLTLLATVIMLVIMLRDEFKASKPSEVKIQNIVNETTITNIVENVNIENDMTYIPRTRPCPCGSGIKYKRCHGGP